METEFTAILAQFKSAVLAQDFDRSYRLLVPYCGDSNAGISASACYLAGVALLQMGNFPKAKDLFERAVSKNSNARELYEIYGRILLQEMDYVRAKDVFLAGMNACGKTATLLAHLAGIETVNGKLSISENLLNEAVSLEPDNPIVWNNLGNLYEVMGRTRESLSCFQKALAIDAKNPITIANLLLTLNYLSMPKATVYQAHKLYMEPLQKFAVPPPEESCPSKKIRIGYISQDFRFHAVAFFFLPIIENYNRSEFETCCYIDNSAQDPITALVKKNSDKWHDVYALSDSQIAEIIARDGIDILVDLSGHSAGRRLSLIKSKPAPIQISYLGYPNTLGISEIDCRIVDSITDPDEHEDEHFCESLIRLKPPFVCFKPMGRYPDVSSLPALKNGYVTFGSCNRLSKLSDQTVKIWSELLARVPRSKLIIKTKALSDDVVARETLARFESNGVAPDRLVLLGWSMNQLEHLSIYQDIDLALDSFSYNGTTTTCESLYMGVPVLTIRGDRNASRVSASIMESVSLKDFVADNVEEFLTVAVNYAADLNSMSSIRTSLRQRVAGSPLMDGKRLTAEIEGAYHSLVMSCRDTRKEPARKTVVEN